MRSLNDKALLGAPVFIAASTLLSWACSSEPLSAPAVGDGSGVPAPVADAGSDPPSSDASGKPPFDPADEPITCANEPCAMEIVAGDEHFCTRMSDGTIRCWGGSSDAGVVAPPIADVKQLSAAAGTTCALVADGGVDCWGRNDKGQLGLGDDKPASDDLDHPTPSRVALPSATRRIDVGPSSACAVLDSGEVWCWGDNSRKQLARATPTGIGHPAKAELGEVDIARTASGTYTGFALTTEGALFSWGAVAGAEGSVGGRLSSLSPDAHAFPVELGPVSSFSVSATNIIAAALPNPARGIGHACAVVGGEVFCWGDSLKGADIGRTLAELTGLIAPPAQDASSPDNRADGCRRGRKLQGVLLEVARVHEGKGGRHRRLRPQRSACVVSGAFDGAVREPCARDVARSDDLSCPGRRARERGSQGLHHRSRKAVADRSRTSHRSRSTSRKVVNEAVAALQFHRSAHLRDHRKRACVLEPTRIRSGWAIVPRRGNPRRPDLVRTLLARSEARARRLRR